MKHVAGNISSVIWEAQREAVSEFEFHFRVFHLQYLLKSQGFNAVSDGSHDGTGEKVTSKSRCYSLFKDG